MKFQVAVQEVSTSKEATPWWTLPGRSKCELGMDPDLEIWIDDRTSPVVICMAGVLDSSTSQSFLTLMDSLLAKGVRQILMDAGALEVADAWGASALTVLQRRARDAGGSLMWEGLELGTLGTRTERPEVLGFDA
jgi:anti-anti-sigma regulatory factor